LSSRNRRIIARIQYWAYELNRISRLGSYRDKASTRPTLPSWIRSSTFAHWRWYWNAILMTRRRLLVTSRCAASRSPVWTYFWAQTFSSSGPSRGYRRTSDR
jgi:hypothetical protein